MAASFLGINAERFASVHCRKPYTGTTFARASGVGSSKPRRPGLFWDACVCMTRPSFLREYNQLSKRNFPNKIGLDRSYSPRFAEIAMPEKDLSSLFLDTLKDIYYAEKQIYKALPKMAKAANSDQLRAAFEKHHDETEGQIERLEQVFELLGKPARGKKCDAIEGILDEGKEIMEEYQGEPALDAGLLASAQAVEHYEISRYGTLKTWASKLGMKDAVKLLDQTLAEEKKTDDALTKLADTAVNAEAQAA
jgi:ferritin-like metal-binding protein YciE